MGLCRKRQVRGVGGEGTGTLLKQGNGRWGQGQAVSERSLKSLKDFWSF